MTTDYMIRAVQKHEHLDVDGIDGRKTWTAIYNSIVGKGEKPAVHIDSTPIPSDSVAAITALYGRAGDESVLERFHFPYPMQLYGGRPITSHRCHRLCKPEIEAILECARDELGMDFIRAHHLDEYFGCFNFRNMRGGSSLSLHSWGIAFDFAANQNGNHVRKPQADMPEEFIAIFERFGWKSGGRAWGRDYMHFQRTRP